MTCCWASTATYIEACTVMRVVQVEMVCFGGIVWIHHLCLLEELDACMRALKQLHDLLNRHLNIV